MIRILHLADLHLGYVPPWQQHAEGRRNERDARLRKAVTWAIDNDLDLVLIAGDLFETHRPPGTLVDAVMSELQRLVASGIAVVTLPGNHDEISYHDSVYRREAKRWPGLLIENPNMQKVASIECRGSWVHIYSLAYTSGITRTDPPLSSFPKPEGDGFHVALLHGSLDWDRGDRSLPIDGRALENAGYDYVALGHIHKRIVRGGKRPIVYPGMIEGKDFDDPGVGQYTVVTLSQAGASLDTVSVDDARPLVTFPIDAGQYENESELVDALKQELPEKAAVRVILTGAPNFPVRREGIEQALTDWAYYVEVLDETAGLADELIEKLALEPTVRGQFVSRMLRRLNAVSGEEQKVVRRALVRGLEALGREERTW